MVRYRSRMLLAQILAVGFVGGVIGCGPVQNAGSLKTAQDLKSDTLALMSKATESYETHRGEIGNLDSRLNSALTVEQSRPKNESTVQMWEMLISVKEGLPGSGIYPRFKKQWEDKDTLQPTYIQNKKDNVGAAFDKIIALEQSRTNPR